MKKLLIPILGKVIAIGVFIALKGPQPETPDTLTRVMFLIWSSLYDVPAQEPLDTMGLLDYDETST